MTEAPLHPPMAAGEPTGATGRGSGTGSAARTPLSLQQEFLKAVDHGDGTGPFGPRYTIVGGWRILGVVDLPTLQGALDDVVARHEALRTKLVPDAEEPYQYVLPPSSPSLRVCDLTVPAGETPELFAEKFLNELETHPLGLDEEPLLRAVLGRFNRRDGVLALSAHHTAVDGWSIHLVVRDLAEIYAARRERRAPVFPPARQYREYVAWQRAAAAPAEALAYWRETLRGTQIVTIPTDMPRRHGEPFVTGWYRFLIGDPVRSAALALARAERSSLFMVLLAAYLVHLRDTTGRTDLVVPTFTPGRSPGWIQDTVGSFYNLLPLRIGIDGCADFRDVIARTRRACLTAYPHEIPFIQLIGEAPELMEPAMDPGSALCVFQVTQSPHMMHGLEAGGLRYTAIRHRVMSADMGSQIPDGVLLGLELQPTALAGSIGYTTNLFTQRSAAGMATAFTEVLARELASAGVLSGQPAQTQL